MYTSSFRMELTVVSAHTFRLTPPLEWLPNPLHPFSGFIDGRRHYLQGIELFYNPACGNSVRIPSENQSYNFSGLRIDNKSVPVLRRLLCSHKGRNFPKIPHAPASWQRYI